MSPGDLPDTMALDQDCLYHETCELHPDTSPSVSTMSRDMRPLCPELRHHHLHQKTHVRTLMLKGVGVLCFSGQRSGGRSTVENSSSQARPVPGLPPVSRTGMVGW